MNRQTFNTKSGGTHGPDSLENYIRQHPKAAGARTLTQARIMAFGRKVSQHGIDVAMNRRPR